MGRLRYGLWPVALAFGIAAEWIGRPDLLALDALSGFALVGLGLVAWTRRPQSGVGPIMAVGGFAWFLGTLWTPAVFLHRGPLAHLLLSYPSGRLSSRLERATVATAYAYAAASPVAGDDYATIGFAVGLVALAARRYLVAGGPDRRAYLTSLSAATVFALVLTLGAAARQADAGIDRAALLAYDVAVCVIAIGVVADLLWGRWTQATVAGLVVDLGEPVAAGALRERLARTFGDPTLVVAYWLPEQSLYVDEAGRPVELPTTGADRVLTPVEENGRRIAALIHDAAVLDDPGLISAVASATRLAVSNARLQAEVRARVAEVDASRRRIVEAADAQRRRLEREVREGAERRLARVSELVCDLDPELRRTLDAAQVELREFARGIHPATLTEHGLAVVHELAEWSPVPIEVVVPPERFPPAIEEAAYFVCSEALVNVAKHARASQASVRVVAADGVLTVEVTDDGVGGADRSLGSGLLGLADRVEALGGQLLVESPVAGGTRLSANLPLVEAPSGSSAKGAIPRRRRSRP
jgi:signal transduction histidine kinase